jgi:hypothetical protein
MPLLAIGLQMCPSATPCLCSSTQAVLRLLVHAYILHWMHLTSGGCRIRRQQLSGLTWPA